MVRRGAVVTRRAAMILAAGFGTRMGAMTRDRPKPLLTVGGRTLLDHALAEARDCAPIVVNGHYRAEQLRSHLARHHPTVRFSHETPTILDSGGAIKAALPILGAAPILTLNADAVWRGPPPHRALERGWSPASMDALLLLVPLARAVGREGGGDFRMMPDGRLDWDRTAGGLVYTGAQILKTESIARHPGRVFSIGTIWRRAMRAGRLFGCPYDGRWADAGHPAGLAQAAAMLSDAV